MWFTRCALRWRVCRPHVAQIRPASIAIACGSSYHHARAVNAVSANGIHVTVLQRGSWLPLLLRVTTNSDEGGGR